MTGDVGHALPGHGHRARDRATAPPGGLDAAALATIVANLRDAVLYTVDGVVQWASRGVEALLGWAPQDLVGGTVSHLWHPDDLAAARALRADVAAGLHLLGVLRIRHREGHYLSVEVAVAPHRADDGADADVTTLRDVTGQVLAERALARSEEQYRLLAENAGDLVFRSSPDGVIEWVSPSALAVLGWHDGDLLGVSIASLLHPDDAAEASAAAVAVTHGQAYAYEARHRRRDGGYVWLAVRARPLLAPDGTVLGRVGGAHVVQAEREARDRLSYREVHDPLTGLRNRSWMLDVLTGELAAARANGRRVGVLVADVDAFRRVNDSLSHAAGDAVLVEVGARIARILGPGDHVGRHGADEFLVVAPDVGGTADLEALAERLCSAVAADLVVDDHVLRPSVSVGIALAAPAAPAADVLRDADLALGRAKRDARGRWHVADARMHAEAARRLTLEGEMRRALPAGEFVVHYQPVVGLRGGRVVGHEALVRWQHPERGLLPPAEFLPVAEESGLVVGIGDAVLDQVCALLAERPDLPGHVAVNVSGVQLARPRWVDGVARALERHGVEPRRLVLEVTETAALSVDAGTLAGLAALREAGVGLHVDDFGTGFSSVALLRDLPVSGLKLDRRFVRDLTRRDSPANALAAGLAGLAAGLGLVAVAEGIERPDQAATLADVGWELGQGYWFGRPAPEPVPG